MKMSGERVIPAPRSRVWEALNDPDVLRQSIPGCIELIKHSDTGLSAKVVAKVGPVKASFAGDVTLSELNPPHSYRISGKGTGGVAGFAEGGADVRLEDAGEETRLLYEVDAKVGGKLAQIGSRLIDSTARRMADDFFNRFVEIVASGEPRTEPDTVAEPELQPAVTPPRKTAARKAVAAKKPAARRSAAGKSAAAKTGAARPSHSANLPAESEPARSLPDEPAPLPAATGTNIWWLVGAGVAALVVFLLLANM